MPASSPTYPPTDDDLRVRGRKASRDLTTADLANMRQTLEGPKLDFETEDNDIVVSAPETNPEWSTDARMVPNRRLPLGSRQALSNLARMEAKTGTTEGIIKKNFLDETIMRHRASGLQPSEIARLIGGSATSESVQERLSAMYAQMSQFSDDEQRMLSLYRLENVINMLWGLAEHGSADHIKLIIEAIDRSNRLLGLEKQVIKTEVRLVTLAQAELIQGVVEAAIRFILAAPALRDRLSQADADELTGSALMQAVGIIEEAKTQTVDLSSEAQKALER